MTKHQQILSGRKAIMAYVGRSWDVIIDLIREERFPAVMIRSSWMAEVSQIDDWMREKVKKACQDKR